MRSQFMKATRAVIYSIALVILSGAPLWGQASDCPDNAVGGQSGQNYRLVGQSLVTVTSTVQLNTGLPCAIGGSAGGTIQEQYNVGFYQNAAGDIARVDCRTGRILGWE